MEIAFAQCLHENARVVVTRKADLARALPSYLLDTNAVIGVLQGHVGLGRRIRQGRPGDFCISAVVMQELYYGAFKSGHAARNIDVIDRLELGCLDFDRDDARHAGQIRALLKAAGTPVGNYDVLIAGQARARNLVLITANVGEFGRVEGLRVENWEADEG